MAKKSKIIPQKKQIKKLEKKKFNKYNIYLGTFSLIIILILIVFYSSFNQMIKEQEVEKNKEIRTPITTTTFETSMLGGFCKRDSQCFITTCKESKVKDCINTTQLTDYHKKCETYSDWIIERQDSSKCGCVQNACKMLK